MPTFSLFLALPGTGKTLSEVDYLVHQFLPLYDGKHISNLPLNVDAIVKYCLAKYGRKKQSGRPQMTEEYIRDRIEVIPESEVKSWMDDEHDEVGPWNYFAGKDLAEARIAIDESHNFFPQAMSNKRKALLRQWMGEKRHANAEVIFMSQSESQVNKTIKDLSAVRYRLKNMEDEVEFFTGFRMYDLYSLQAKISLIFTKAVAWEPKVIRITEIQGARGRWAESRQARYSFRMKPELYPLYNSFSAGHSEHSAKGAKGIKREYEKLDWVPFFKWMFKRNMDPIVQRFLIVVIILAVYSFGPSRIMGALIDRLNPIDEMTAAVNPSTPQNQALQRREQVRSQSNQVTEEQRRYMELQERVETAEQALDDLTNDMALAAEVVAIYADSFMLADGRRYLLGEIIPTGALQGRYAIKISLRLRVVVLDGGDKLWLEL